uniref:Protein sleepless n=1 Tax=Biomphalaria glabrata TaxID=6526 RepID=A0A2C9LHG4_BIOGL
MNIWRMLDKILVLLLALLDGSFQKFAKPTTGVGCYKCHSMNGSDAHCGDPFHPAFNMDRYHTKCEQGQNNRIGLFPARYCTKIKGTNLKTNEEMIIRSCSLYAFENTCGMFQFDNVHYTGCLMSCTRDACNSGRSTYSLDRRITRTLMTWATFVMLSAFTTTSSLS